MTSNMSKLPAWNGVIYFSDTSAGTSVNTTFSGSTVSTSNEVLPENGATFAKRWHDSRGRKPGVYSGDFNTGGTYNSTNSPKLRYPIGQRHI